MSRLLVFAPSLHRESLPCLPDKCISTCTIAILEQQKAVAPIIGATDFLSTAGALNKSYAKPLVRFALKGAYEAMNMRLQSRFW